MPDFVISVSINAGGVKAGAGQVRREMAELDGAARKTGKGMESVARTDFSGLKSQLSGLKSSFLAIFGGNLASSAVQAITSELVQGGKAILDYSSRMQQTGIAFETLMGNADAAKQHLAELKKFAVDTPFEFENLAVMSQRLQGVGVDAKAVIPLMTDLGNVVAATGKISAERIEGVTTAISQMIAKGKVSAEEMEQLSERGVPAWQMLSEAIGKTQAETRKLAETGAITSDQMVAAFQKISREKFGDAMQKQSRTYEGALSTIRDVTAQAAEKAFAPFFEKITSLAVELSQRVQAAGGDLQGVGALIGQYIVAGLTEALKQGVTAAVTSIFTGLRDRWNDLLSGDLLAFSTVFNDKRSSFIGKGLYDALLGKETGTGVISTVTNVLSQVNSEVKKIDQSAKKVPSIAKNLEGAKAQKEAETLRKTVYDLALKVQFFGDETEVAATKQRLLAAGISDFSSASAKSALNLSAILDFLKQQDEWRKKDRDRQKEQLEKLEDQRKELLEIRHAADFDLRFANPSEIDRFNESVRRGKFDFLNLKTEINATREAIAKLAFANAVRDRNNVIGNVARQIKEAISELKETDVSAFRQKLESIVGGIDLMDAAGNRTSTRDFSRYIENRIKSLQSDLRKSIALADGITGDPALIEKELKDRNKKLVDAWYDDLQIYLSNFKKETINPATKQKTFINVFADSVDFENIANLIELFNQFEDLTDNSNLSAYTSLYEDLNSKLLESAQNTEVLRVQKALLRDEYKNLSDAQRQELLDLAAQIDAQNELNDTYARFHDFVSESLRVLADEGFGGMFKSIAKRFKDMLIQMAADWITSKLFNLINPSGGGSGSGGGGGFFGDLINGIRNMFNLGGGGGNSSSGSGGRGIYTTPSFNPNSFVATGGGAGIGGNSWYAQNQTILDGIINSPGGTNSGSMGSGRNVNVGGIGRGMFGPVNNVITGNPSSMAGTMSGIGAIASMVGGFVPGRAGNTLSMAGMGLQIGAMFGPWGAAIGAAAGALLGFFGYNDPKRKADKQQNMPKLQQGFTDAMNQLRALLNDRNAIFNDPDGIMQKATELRGQIASGFGIQFQSKKYKAQAQTQIAAKLREADDIIKQLNDLAKGYTVAHKIDDRLETSFATGVYMSSDFLRQYEPYKRRNGMLAGAWTGRDTLPSMLAAGEMVLNPMQISRVRERAGFDVFKGAGIPGYNTGAYIQPAAQPARPIESSQRPADNGPTVINLVLQNVGIVESDIKQVLVDSLDDRDVQVKITKANDRGKSRTK